ncbi:MAG: hypothetical protein ON057_001689 [Glomeribacter sp. 1016415]|nr:hypothetical protein [Glomeribacter sp. 1016415]
MFEMKGNGQICWLLVLRYAAFTGGPGTGTERKPTGISIAEITEVNTFNASTCRQWLEQALALRAFYQQLKIN